MNKICLTIFFLCVYFVNAQNTKTYDFEISGSLIADNDQLPLESATIYLEQKKDSTLVTYTLSDAKGQFFLEGKTKTTDLQLSISYVGYKPIRKNIDLTKNNTIDFKKLTLDSDLDELNAVVLKVSPPITVKKDTLEFNVRSFKTKKDANVEDLLKKLPGVEVDDDGQITINGKPVNKILINGKPFFGNDPTIATKNFPKDIIEKIQVLDTKTKSQAFTGEQADGENKTVNLVVKKENNKGVFGRTAAGIGTDDKYQYAGMYNRFDNDEKFSALAGGNNINSPGFSYGEIRDMFGGGSGVSSNSLGRGNGITTSDNAGLNYANDYGKNIEFSSNYFFSRSDSDNEVSSESEQILEEETYYTNSRSTSSSQNYNHTANIEFDIKRDSTWLFNIAPSFKYNQQENHNISYKESLDEVKDTVNTSNNSTFNKTNKGDFATDLDITKRYGIDGGFIRVRTSAAFTSEKKDNFLNSETIVTNDESSNVLRDQFTDVHNTSQNLNTSFTYRQPLIANLFFLDVKYSFVRNRNQSDEKTYDYDDDTALYNSFNSDLSTDYVNIDQSHVPGISFSLRNKKISLRFSNYYRFRSLENTDDLRPEYSIKKEFNNFEQNTNLRYRISNMSSLNFNYRYQNSPPSLRYLQAFEDVSDPTNTIIGNPDLKPQTSHDMYAYYNYFNHQKQYGFNGFVYGSIVNDKTVTDRTIDENYISTTEYKNVDGNRFVTGRIEGNKTFKFTDKTSLSLRLQLRPRFEQNVAFNNGVLYNSKVTSFEPSLRLRYDWRDVFEISTQYNPEYTNTKYNISSMENQKFTTHQARINTTTKVPEKLEWSNTLNFNYNPNVADGFQKSSWFWNMSVSYSVLKDKGLISLNGYDILNQNTNVRRWASGNTITDYRSTVLKQYFMLGFSWKFNTLGDRATQKRGSGRRRGRRF